MATFNEFLIDAANCLSYNSAMYARILRQGKEDLCLKAKVNFLAICLDNITRAMHSDTFTMEEIHNLSVAFRRICGNPALRTIGEDVDFLPAQIFINNPVINIYGNATVTIVNNTYYIITPGDTVLLVDTSVHNTTIVVPTTYLQALKSGSVLVIKDKTGNANVHPITVVTEGAELIDSQDQYIINHSYLSISMTSDETNYFLI